MRSSARPPRDPADDLLSRSFGRRSLLRTSVSGIGLLLGGALLPAGCRSYPDPPVSLGFFTAQEYAVFQAVARAMLGLEDDGFDVAAEVDRLVMRMDGRVRRDIRWILRIFEHGTHLFDLKGPRFTRLDRSDQEEYLRGWMTSSLGARRLVFRGLKLLASLGYYGSEATWNRIGYAGPWLGRVEAAPLRTPEKPVPFERLEQS